MPRKQFLSREKRAWWNEREKHIARLDNDTRSALRKELMNAVAIITAELYLWEEVLKKEGLGKWQAMGRLVYIGEERLLDGIHSGNRRVTSRGNWSAVRSKKETTPRG
jgi:hypothetical protein